MNMTTKDSVALNFDAPVALKLPIIGVAAGTADPDRVRIGAQSPMFRTIKIADAGAVRLGAQSPVFRKLVDAGRVRLGAQGPVFR